MKEVVWKCRNVGQISSSYGTDICPFITTVPVMGMDLHTNSIKLCTRDQFPPGHKLRLSDPFQKIDRAVLHSVTTTFLPRNYCQPLYLGNYSSGLFPV